MVPISQLLPVAAELVDLLTGQVETEMWEALLKEAHRRVAGAIIALSNGLAVGWSGGLRRCKRGRVWFDTQRRRLVELGLRSDQGSPFEEVRQGEPRDRGLGDDP